MASMSKIGLVLSFFIIITIGLSLINPLADSTAALSKIETVTNESFAGVNNTAVAIANNDLVAVSAVRLASTSAVVTPANYTVDAAAGTILLINQSTATYNVDYTHYGNNYVKDGTSRTLMNIIIIFFVLGIIGIAIAFMRDIGDEFFKN